MFTAHNAMNNMTGIDSIGEIRLDDMLPPQMPTATPISQLIMRSPEYDLNQLHRLADDINSNMPLQPQLQQQVLPIKKRRKSIQHHKHDVNMKKEKRNRIYEDMDVDIEQGFGNNIPRWIYEYLIVIVLYYLVTNSAVRNFAHQYIKQLGPEPDGQYGYAATLMYGVILALLLFVCKKLFKL